MADQRTKPINYRRRCPKCRKAMNVKTRGDRIHDGRILRDCIMAWWCPRCEIEVGS